MKAEKPTTAHLPVGEPRKISSQVVDERMQLDRLQLDRLEWRGVVQTSMSERLAPDAYQSRTGRHFLRLLYPTLAISVAMKPNITAVN